MGERELQNQKYTPTSMEDCSRFCSNSEGIFLFNNGTDVGMATSEAINIASTFLSVRIM